MRQLIRSKALHGSSDSMRSFESLMRWKTASSRRRKESSRFGSEHVDVLLRGVDMLAQVAQLGEAEVEAWQTEHADEIDALVTELNDGQGRSAAAAFRAVTSGGATTGACPRPCPSPAMDESRAEAGASSTGRPNGVIIAPVVVPPVPSTLLTEQLKEIHRLRRPAQPRVADRGRDRVVRVTAESLTRLLGLAGEALVQSHRLPPLVDSLWRLKGKANGTAGVAAGPGRPRSRIDQENRLTAADRERLAKVKAQASQCLQKLGETVEAIEEFARQSEDLSSRLHHEVLASRMRPLADGIRGFPRLVRDLARELGKQARFEVVGETTGVDRDILDRLESPLNHLIRNALDHGARAA